MASLFTLPWLLLELGGVLFLLLWLLFMMITKHGGRVGTSFWLTDPPGFVTGLVT